MFRLIKRRFAISSYVRQLPQVLLRRFGKKRFYSVEEVSKSAQGAALPMAFIAYAHAIFCDRESFEAHYQPLAVRCNYDELRATVSRRYFGGVRDFDAAQIISATKRDNDDDFYESGIGQSGS